MPSPRLKGISRHIGNEGEIVNDDSLFPLYVSNSRGVWDYNQVVAWYEARNRIYDAAVHRGLKVFLITDISELKPPNATLRKQLSDLGQKYDAPYRGVWIGQVFIMTNPLLRGIVTAVNWLSPSGFVAPTSTAPSLRQAINIMNKAYREAKAKPPEVPPDFKLPSFSS